MALLCKIINILDNQTNLLMVLASAKNIGWMLNTDDAPSPYIAIVNHLDKHAPHVTLSHIHTKHSNAGLTEDIELVVYRSIHVYEMNFSCALYVSAWSLVMLV